MSQIRTTILIGWIAFLLITLTSSPLIAQKNEKTLNVWLKQLKSKNILSREKASQNLIKLGRQAVPAVTQLLYKRDLAMRSLASYILVQIGRPALTKIHQVLTTGPWWAKEEACLTLSELQHRTASIERTLKKLTRAKHWRVRQAAIKTLARIGRNSWSTRQILRTSLNDNHPYIRVAAANALSRFGNFSDLPRLQHQLDNEANSSIRNSLRRSISQLEKQLKHLQQKNTTLTAKQKKLALRNAKKKQVKKHKAKKEAPQVIEPMGI